MIFWIILPIFLCLLLYTGTRNLIEFDFYNRNPRPLKFTVGTYLLVLMGVVIPGLNIAVAIALIIFFLCKISEGDDGDYDGWRLKEGKRNWIYSMYKLLTKKI